jgi:hypothetical protein
MFALGAAFSLATLLMFLTTTVAFDAQFIARIPLFAVFMLIALHLVAVLREQSIGKAIGALVRATFRHALSVTGVLLLALAVSPAVLATLFTSDRDLANFITRIRIGFADRGDYAWGFADALPGRRFHQPMVVQFPPGQDKEVWLLERGGRLLRVPWSEPGHGEVMLDISGQVGHVEVENGALGFDFHPDFGRGDSEQRNAVYVYYTAVQDDRQTNRLSRFDLGRATSLERAATEDVLILW